MSDVSSFKKAAYTILESSRSPLHYREITNRAIQQKLLKTKGKTPWVTMNEVLSEEVRYNSTMSPFVKTDPGYFALKQVGTIQQTFSDTAMDVRRNTDLLLSAEQKANIAISRICDLILMYGKDLLCYRLNDQANDGIDMIVRKTYTTDSICIRVLSVFGYTNQRGGSIHIKTKTIIPDKRILLVFTFFDIAVGDLSDLLVCIPAHELANIVKGKKSINISFKKADNSPISSYVIDKRELGEKISDEL